MINSEELINKVKLYNKFLNPEALGNAYNFALDAQSLEDQPDRPRSN